MEVRAAIAEASRTQKGIKTLSDLPANLVDEIEHFFVSYNAAKGKRFEPTGRFGPQKAKSLVEAGARLWKKQKTRRARKS